MAKTDLDPFRIAVGVIATARDSDALIGAVTAAGLRFAMTLTAEEAYSNKTRVRALVPRVFAAYDALPEDSQLAAARGTINRLAQINPDVSAAALDALAQAGWRMEGGELLAADPKLREMFFPRGSQWDAFVVIRDLLLEATTDITIMDAYADGRIFQLLAARPAGPLHVRILCSRYAPAVAAEARAFTAQRPDIAFEVRTTRDFHDRFIVLDHAACVHVGASINNAGGTAFMISRVEDADNRASLLATLNASWQAGTRVP